MSETRDYNGSGEWSGAEILRRYRRHAEALGQAHLLDLTPHEHSEGSVRWSYPVMDQVIAGIKAADPACIELGIEFIERGGPQPFGRTLHANTARALRRASLSATQVERLRRHILAMLVEAQVPHEYHEYAKLLRHVGLGSHWPETAAMADLTNPYVMRYVRYFEKHALDNEATTASSKPLRQTRSTSARKRGPLG